MCCHQLPFPFRSGLQRGTMTRMAMPMCYATHGARDPIRAHLPQLPTTQPHFKGVLFIMCARARAMDRCSRPAKGQIPYAEQQRTRAIKESLWHASWRVRLKLDPEGKSSISSDPPKQTPSTKQTPQNCHAACDILLMQSECVRLQRRLEFGVSFVDGVCLGGSPDDVRATRGHTLQVWLV